MYFLVTILSASPQETKALSRGHNTWQRSLAKGAACFAGIETASRQSEEVPELKLLVGLKSQLHTGLETTHLGGSLLPTERFLLIPHGSAFAKTKLPVTGCFLFGGEGPPCLSYMFYRCLRPEGVYRSARGCISSMQSLNCFGRPNWGLIITSVEKAALTHFTFGQSLRRKNSPPAQYSGLPIHKLTSHPLPSFASSSFH